MKIRIYDSNLRKEYKSGYGLMSFQISQNLKQLGHEVVFFPDDKTGEDIVLWIRPPHYIKQPEFDSNKKNVFFTMHETETFEGWKSDWPNLLNRCTAVIVPTEWNKKVFEKNGVIVPIHVIPLGVNPKDFHGDKTYRFSILTLHDALGSDNSRENWKDTFSAYFKAFYDFHPQEVELNIKSYNIKSGNVDIFINSILGGKDREKIPPYNILDINLESESLNNLYSKHWLFVKNANREGWSLPLWEALSARVRVVHTDLPVFENIPPDKTIRFKLGDVDGLANIFLNEFKYWREEKGFINNYTWKKCTGKVLDILKTI